MKVWCESTYNYLRDEGVHFGVVSYFHKWKEWRGFTITIFFMDCGFSLTAVSNYAEYDKRVNWWKPEHKAAAEKLREDRRQARLARRNSRKTS